MKFKNINLVIFTILITICSCSNGKKIASLPNDTIKESMKPAQLANEVKNSDAEQIENTNLQNKISPIIIGNIIAPNQSSLAFLNTGTIEKIYVKAGQSVKKNQVLAALDSTQQHLNLVDSEIKLKQQKLNLELENKKLQRIREQYSAGIVNKPTLENEKTKYNSFLLDIESLENDVQSKKYQLQLTKILAPYDGVISQKNKSVGDFITTGTTVFQITQNKNLQLYAKIPGIYIDKIKLGQLLKFNSSNNKNQIGEIKIDKLIPVFDNNSRTFDIYGEILNFNGNLNPGNFVEVKL